MISVPVTVFLGQPVEPCEPKITTADSKIITLRLTQPQPDVEELTPNSSSSLVLKNDETNSNGFMIKKQEDSEVQAR